MNYKCLILLVFLFFIKGGTTLFAQLEVKENSFKEVTGFVNLNLDKQTDDNDQPYAVLKIRTENIDAKQRRELEFKGDARTFFEIEYKDGEVWLYISYYATFIKISHPDLSSVEFYFPFDMLPKKGYELTLVNNAKSDMDEEKVLSLIERWQQNKQSADTMAQTSGQLENAPVKKHAFNFVTANVAIDNYGDMSYGVTFGSYRKFGWFLSMMSNFDFKGLSADYQCNNELMVGTYYPDYNGKERYTTLSVMGGFIYKIAEPVALRIGVGYGVRNTVYETTNNKIIKNSDISVSGVDVSLGAHLKLKGFVISAEAVTTNFKTIEAKIGLGYGFIK